MENLEIDFGARLDRPYTDDIDPSTIPDRVLASERGRRNAAKRIARRGGRPITCSCGTCPICKRRAKRRAKGSW